MKLSVIIPIVKKRRFSFLEELIDNFDQNLEIILVIDNYWNLDFEIFEKLEKLYGTNLVLITNSKRQGYIANVIQGIMKASAAKIWITTQSGILVENNFNSLWKALAKFDVDVLEFPLNFKDEINWSAKQRISDQRIFNIKQNPEFLAYAFPILQNKIFNKTLLLKSLRYLGLSKTNSIFSLELLYLTLAKAKTYCFWKEPFHALKISYNQALAPTLFLREWRNIFKYLNEFEFAFNNELLYAKYYFFFIFLSTNLANLKKRYPFRKIDKLRRKTTQNSFLIPQLEKELLIMRKSDNFKAFQATSPYLIRHHREVYLINNHIRASKWNDIIKKL